MLAVRGRTSLLKAIYGGAVDVDNQNIVFSSPACCKRGCPNRNGVAACVGTTGGFEHLVSMHINHLGTESDNKPREKKHKNASGGCVKNRGQVASRKQRLQDLLDEVVWCEQVDPNGKDHVYGYNFTLLHSSGRSVAVCKNYFAAVHGYTPAHTQWRKCMDRAERRALQTRAAAEGIGLPLDDGPREQDPILRGHRSRLTLNWFAQFIRNYAQPLPMRKELRFDFGHATSLYVWLRSELVAQVGEASANLMLVGCRRFRQLLQSPDLLHQPSIKAAMQEKLGCSTDFDLDVQGWVLKWMDPSKKRDFSLCGCCTRLHNLLGIAVRKADAELHKKATSYMRHHLQIARMRRDKFVQNQQIALANPDQVLTMIVDAMDHSKLDGPVVHRSMRWSKDVKEQTLAPCHLIGGLTWGHCNDDRHGRARTWLYWHDALIGGKDAGKNSTCEVIMKTLEQLRQTNELPTDAKRRVLNLQCDNCGDNKNWCVLLQCALLVWAGTFTEVNLDFLPVGHTHEVIDQVFAVIADWLRHTDEDISTFDKLQAKVKQILSAYHSEELDGVRNFAEAGQDMMTGKMRGHSKPFSYRFEMGEDQNVKMTFQTNGRTDGEWYDGPCFLENPQESMKLKRFPLLKYKATKMFKAGQDGKPDVDKFSEAIDKLNAMTTTFNGEALPVAPQSSFDWWRQKVVAWTDKTERKNRLKSVRTKVNYNMLRPDQQTTTDSPERDRFAEQIEQDGADAGIWSPDRRNCVRVTNTEFTDSKVRRLNAVNEVLDKMAARWAAHERGELPDAACPAVGEFVLYVYQQNEALKDEPGKKLVYGGLVMQVHKYDDPADKVYMKENTVSGPQPNSLETPTFEEKGLLRGFQLCVQTFEPVTTKALEVATMSRLPSTRYLSTSWGPTVHQKLDGDRRPDSARLEKVWIDLEDVVASKYVLGRHIEPDIVKRNRPPYTFRSLEKHFKLTHKSRMGGYADHGDMDDRIRAALDHHACANSNHRCEKCKEVFARQLIADDY